MIRLVLIYCSGLRIKEFPRLIGKGSRTCVLSCHVDNACLEFAVQHKPFVVCLYRPRECLHAAKFAQNLAGWVSVQADVTGVEMV